MLNFCVIFFFNQCYSYLLTKNIYIFYLKIDRNLTSKILVKILKSIFDQPEEQSRRWGLNLILQGREKSGGKKEIKKKKKHTMSFS